MQNLPLALAIAELVDDAQAHGRRIDVGAEARRLLDDHPESTFSIQETEEAIRWVARECDVLTS
jgi:hypothetical protein